MYLKKSKASGLLATLITIVLLLGLGFAAMSNRQWIIDQYNYWTYHPSSTMQSFAQRSAMSSEGKFLFYASQPKLQDAASFNKSCPNQGGGVAVLGCYDNQYIYIYDVTNPKLDGIREVTAAYEMLHAAYKRTHGSDLTKLNQLIESTYAQPANEAIFKPTVDYFATTEPGERDNELFSLIATQVRTVDPQLEAYYNRYFTNRQTLVDLYNKYSSVFTAQENQTKAYAQQLSDLSAQINQETAQYTQDVNQLNADIAGFNARANSNQFSSMSQFYSERSALNARVSALESERSTINDQITNYNNIVKLYEASALASNELYKSIDSTLAPTPSV